jgi:O-antigen biosynthesis protein
LVGEGEAKDAAEAIGVPDHVHLEGFRANTQDYFAAADLGFLPSRFKGESFPLVVIESLIAGTPVLASDVGEIRYMLTTERGMAGILFPLAEEGGIDIESLARTIADLAADRTKVMRLQAQVPLAARRFNPRRMAESYDEVYRAAAEPGQPQKDAGDQAIKAPERRRSLLGTRLARS